METQKDLWEGHPDIVQKIAKLCWKNQHRVSFELIDSSEERISFLKDLLEKTEKERLKLIKEYPVMSPEEVEALSEGNRYADLTYFNRDPEGFIASLKKDIVSMTLTVEKKQTYERFLDLIERYRPATEKRSMKRLFKLEYVDVMPSRSYFLIKSR